MFFSSFVFFSSLVVATIFNTYFSNQYSINDNDSVWPRFAPNAEVSLLRIPVNKEQIVKIINTNYSKGVMKSLFLY